MLAEALAGLASAGGTALVSAMVTDGWESVKARCAQLLGRGEASRAEAAAVRLEESRAALVGLSGAGLERARAEQEVVWRTRLGDLLKQDPAAQGDLRALVAEVQALTIGVAGRIEQHATASGQAQQAIQGQGVQNVTFGGRHGPGTSAG
jgi:hypothetical protein